MSLSEDSAGFPPTHLWLVAVMVAILLSLVGCGGGADGSGSEQESNGDGPVHVHGLGVNPADGALFIATHTGLFRAGEGQATSERVADRYQDTMGFTVVGPNHFLGSGHPDLREELPPLLGLVESRDGGETWKSISLLGEADFHVLESRGRRVYGFDSSSGRLMVSRDGGRQWEERTPPEPLLSLAVHPDDPDRVIASGERKLISSTDGGRRWRTLEGSPGLLTWPDRRHVYQLQGHGALLVSREAGRHWDPVGELGGQPAAFESGRDGDLLAALHDGTVKESTDGGKRWRIRSKP
jgi:hypothetical protein